MDKLRNSLIRFMQGRYGTDQFNFFLMIAALIVDFIGMFARSGILMFLADAVLIYVIWRGLSRNINKRAIENRKFMERTAGIRRTWSAFRKGQKDKDHRYYVCPKCHQLVRVPRGRGRITITCPTCRNQFNRKS